MLLGTLNLWGKPQLLFHCGITMVPAMMEAAASFEKNHYCTILINQGGSKDLCKTIKDSHRGDLFLPGKDAYIDQCGAEGYIRYQQAIGYNRLAIFVPRGNPKHIRGLRDLLRSDLVTVIGNPETGSIGKAAEETLMRYGGAPFWEKALANLGFFAVDSRDMNQLLISGKSDVGLNWTATAHTDPAINHLEVIPIFDLYSRPETLTIASLKYSKHPELSRAFIDYLCSPAGQAIMSKYGFSHE